MVLLLLFRNRQQKMCVLLFLLMYVAISTAIVDGLHYHHQQQRQQQLQQRFSKVRTSVVNNKFNSISPLRQRQQPSHIAFIEKREERFNDRLQLQQSMSTLSLSLRCSRNCYTDALYCREKFRNNYVMQRLQSLRTLHGGGTRIHSSSHLKDTSSSGNGTNQSSKVSLLSELMMEMMGTFFIVQLGTASIMSAVFMAGNGGISGLFAIASVWSIAITTAIYCTSSLCDAHFNPAITIAMYLYRSFHQYKVLPYITSQFIGAILASFLNLLLYSPYIRQYEVINNIVRSSRNAIPSAKVFGEYYVGVSTFHAFFVEVFATFVLSSVIFNVTHPKNKVTQQNDNSKWIIPPIIGSTVGLLICCLAPITQCGMNPARDFGPRIVSYLAGWKSVAFYPSIHKCLFVYIIGPILGAIFGATLIERVVYR